MDFNKLIENNKNNVKNIIRLITKEYNEDLEQEVYIKAWQNSHKYEEQGKFKSWINTIAKNISKDYLKSAKVRYETKTADDELTFNSIKDKKLTPEQVFISKQRQKRITNAINELKPKFKEVIIMYEIEGKELAFGCCRPEETVLSHKLHTAALRSEKEKAIITL